MEQDFFVHQSSYVDEGVVLGKGCKVWHFCHLMGPSELGENCNLGQNVVVSPQVKLGRNVKIQNNVSVFTGVECEDDVFLGPSMVFTNVYNPRAAINRKDEYRRTLVKTGATIGANATIVCELKLEGLPLLVQVPLLRVLFLILPWLLAILPGKLAG